MRAGRTNARCVDSRRRPERRQHAGRDGTAGQRPGRGAGDPMSAGHTDNHVVIAAPLQRVWEMTNDVASWPWLYSEYAAAEILDKAENYVRFRLTTRPDENGNTWSWI